MNYEAYKHVVYHVPGPHAWTKIDTQDIDPLFSEKNLEENKQLEEKGYLRCQPLEIHLEWAPSLAATATNQAIDALIVILN